MTYRLTGFSLMLGGILYLFANTILTVAMPQDGLWTDMFASDAFLHRLSTAAAAVFFLLVGAVGLYNRHATQISWFGKLAFGITFIGCTFIFAHEWGQVFFLHELAKAAPQGLQALEDIEGFNLYDIEPIAGLSLFMIGWLLFAISMLIARVLNPVGPILLIVGLIAIPILAQVLPDLWGFIVGNVIVGTSWVVMGKELATARE